MDSRQNREILTVNTAEKKEKAKQQATLDSTHVAVGFGLASESETES